MPRINITMISDYFQMHTIIVIHIYDICIVVFLGVSQHL
jgi:hypothetical protein